MDSECSDARLLERSELVAAGICRGRTWDLRYCNRLLAAMLEISPGPVSGAPLLTLLTRHGFEKASESQGTEDRGEVILHRRKGDLCFLQWSETACAEGSADLCRLVTLTAISAESFEAQATLLAREYSTLLNSIYDGIWVIDADGMTVHVNQAMERIAGIRAEDVVGKHVTAAVEEGLFSTCVTLRALAEKRAVTMFDDYSNGKRCLNTSTPIFDGKGNIRRVIASIRDMTELESLQRKLADLEEETKMYKAGLAYLESALDEGFVGYSAAMRRLRKEVAKAARTEAVTLILGETGTGKTHAAKVIHNLSARRDRPFIAVNCGAIPMSLMESELFGYDKGAFTGAAPGGKPGMFELAHKGTLLLDEIGELPLPMQAKLLQVLDGHPFHRVGGTKPITTDVRVIAATNRPLAAMAAEGRFREDLFYRLRVLSVDIPPLRERPDDIPLLAMYFLREAAKKSSVKKNFEARVLNHMLTYPWPGNVRELSAIVQSLATMSDDETITVDDLPSYMRAVTGEGETQPVPPGGALPPPSSLRAAVEEVEKNLIMAALAETGSTYKAARRLKVSQSTIFRKAQRYRIGLVEVPHEEKTARSRLDVK